jgi:hypothetical protein
VLRNWRYLGQSISNRGALRRRDRDAESRE